MGFEIYNISQFSYINWGCSIKEGIFKVEVTRGTETLNVSGGGLENIGISANKSLNVYMLCLKLSFLYANINL